MWPIKVHFNLQCLCSFFFPPEKFYMLPSPSASLYLLQKTPPGRKATQGTRHDGQNNRLFIRIMIWNSVNRQDITNSQSLDLENQVRIIEDPENCCKEPPKAPSSIT